MHAQHQYGKPWPQPSNFPKNLNSAPAWHVNVQNYQVPFMILYLLEDLLRIARFSADSALKAMRQDLCHTCA
jgi:hypothetical protein